MTLLHYAFKWIPYSEFNRHRIDRFSGLVSLTLFISYEIVVIKETISVPGLHNNPKNFEKMS